MVSSNCTSQYDVVIHDGLVVDGSGSAPFRANIAIKGDKIAAISPDAMDGVTNIDASGQIVTPGFIDIHTHYDGQAIWSDRLSPSSSHGVTTVVLGNCGVGFAPCRPQDHDLLVKVMEGVEDIPGVVMTTGLDWNWETFPQYLAALEGRPRDIDVAVLLPHSPLRVYVMGERGASREAATEDDLQKMYNLTSEALDAGAVGFATSRLLWHRTKSGDQIPSFNAADDEIAAITRAMKDKGKGIIQMVLDAPNAPWKDEMQHLIRAVEAGGRPATFTLGTANSGPKLWLEAMEAVEQANLRGLQIYPQVLPRPIGLLMGHELSTNPFIGCPSYLKLEALPFAEKIERLKDPAIKLAILSEAPLEGNNFAANARNWDWIFPLGNTPNYDPDLSTSLATQALNDARPPEELAYEYMLENDGRALLFNTLGNFHNGDLDALFDLMSKDDVVVGLGDGGAHYGAICDASYPTFMLTYWINDRPSDRFSFEHMVHLLTARPAKVMGFTDRGRIAVGLKADLNVIDLQALRLHAPYVCHDLPAGGRRLDQKASGYTATICSGVIICEHDEPTSARPGRLVRDVGAASA